jgi:hypothetical protein
MSSVAVPGSEGQLLEEETKPRCARLQIIICSVPKVTLYRQWPEDRGQINVDRRRRQVTTGESWRGHDGASMSSTGSFGLQDLK